MAHSFLQSTWLFTRRLKYSKNTETSIQRNLLISVSVLRYHLGITWRDWKLLDGCIKFRIVAGYRTPESVSTCSAHSWSYCYPYWREWRWPAQSVWWDGRHSSAQTTTRVNCVPHSQQLLNDPSDIFCSCCLDAITRWLFFFHLHPGCTANVPTMVLRPMAYDILDVRPSDAKRPEMLLFSSGSIHLLCNW